MPILRLKSTPSMSTSAVGHDDQAEQDQHARRTRRRAATIRPGGWGRSGMESVARATTRPRATSDDQEEQDVDEAEGLPGGRVHAGRCRRSSAEAPYQGRSMKMNRASRDARNHLSEADLRRIHRSSVRDRLACDRATLTCPRVPGTSTADRRADRHRSGRCAGTDAERRAAVALRERLEAAGRPAEIQADPRAPPLRPGARAARTAGRGGQRGGRERPAPGAALVLRGGAADVPGRPGLPAPPAPARWARARPRTWSRASSPASRACW